MISLSNHIRRLFLPVLVCCALAAPAAAESRRMAVTVDDLPIAGAVRKDADARSRITNDLLAAFTPRDIPATGFVNEAKLYVDGELDDARVTLLRQWLDAGMDLGNHTFSHPDLHQIPLVKFQDDVLRGETVTKPLLAERNRRLEYFRHPFLHTGMSLVVKSDLEQFLADHRYAVAPVTIDNSEWIFAWAYDLALQDGDPELAAQIGADYVDYMVDVVDYYEGQSAALFDRNIDHVLLIHANDLNSAWFGELADRLLQRGYDFIALSDALQDPAYNSQDTYTGRGGITWLHRWALTRDVDPALFRGEPTVADYVLELTGQQSR